MILYDYKIWILWALAELATSPYFHLALVLALVFLLKKLGR